MVQSDVGEIVLEALESRRSMARVTEEAPPRHLVERVIEAAVWAPNHYRTEPWRFAVIAGRQREVLGEVMAQSLRGSLESSDQDGDQTEIERLLERERLKPMRAPVLIAVGAAISDNPKVVEIEEIASVAAGVQNMLLAAEALGLGAMWRTGRPARDPAVKRFLGFAENDHLLAFVYLGYPDLPELQPRTRSAQHLTQWLGWETD